MVLALLFFASLAAAQDVPCHRERALDEAASQLVAASGPPNAESLTAALASSRTDLPFARALDLPARSPSRIVRFLDALRSREASPIVCGVAQAGDRTLVVAAPRRGSLRVENHRVIATLAPGFHAPEIVIEEGGELVRVALEDGALDLEDMRPARIQLVARGPAGPLPIASLVLAPTEAAHASGASIADRIAALRAQEGAPALRGNRLLDVAAREHAIEVCAEGRAAHDLAGSDPNARVGGLGLSARSVGEVVSRGRDRDAAFAALEASPSHRYTLASRTFTDIGIGEARTEASTCVVALFAAWPRAR